MGRRIRHWHLAAFCGLLLAALIVAFLYGACNAAGLRDVLDRLASGEGDEFAVEGEIKVVFVSDRDGDEEIWLMTYDRGNNTIADLTQLTFNGDADKDPEWSPDKTKIVFSTNRGTGSDFELFIINTSGGILDQLTDDASGDTHDYWPDWSPTGDRIVYNRFIFPNDEIWVMDDDGTNKSQLSVASGRDAVPDWSPDRSKIAFMSNRDVGGSTFQIYLMKSDGSDAGSPTRLTINDDDDRNPVWSPDGTKIAFQRKDSATTDMDIWIMDSDGGNETNLTNNAFGDDKIPDWSPDGKQIIFGSNRSGNDDIWVMNADGSGQKQVTTNTAEDKQPNW